MSEILPSHNVIPLQHIDYPDWHKQRTQFSLWYIHIECPKIIEYCQQQRFAFQHLLNQDYQRQWHISLFINGFWVKQRNYDDDFTAEDLQQQIHALTSLQLRPFQLTISHLGSFDNCLYLQILPHESLHKMRQVLAQTHHEISPTIYQPHITLGFYKDAFLKQDILSQIQQYSQQNISFTVNKIIFGHYQAKELQGELTHHFEFIF